MFNVVLFPDQGYWGKNIYDLRLFIGQGPLRHWASATLSYSASMLDPTCPREST